MRVEVNGRPAVLIVDTGSNLTIISSEVADVQPPYIGQRSPQVRVPALPAQESLRKPPSELDPSLGGITESW